MWALPEAVVVSGVKIKEVEINGKGQALGVEERILHHMWFKMETGKRLKGIVMCVCVDANQSTNRRGGV